MSDIKRQSTLKRVLEQEVEVKPKLLGPRADSLIMEPRAEMPMFSQRKHLTELNRHGTDPYGPPYPDLDLNL